MKLKPIPHDSDTCAVARCRTPRTVIDSTGYLAKSNVPLCDRHWVERLEIKKTKEDKKDGKVHQP